MKIQILSLIQDICGTFKDQFKSNVVIAYSFRGIDNIGSNNLQAAPLQSKQKNKVEIIQHYKYYLVNS